MIFYDGSTGSLGFYFAGALEREGRPGAALRSRLGDTEALRRELESACPTRDLREVALVQMAAKVSVPECEREPEVAHRTNVDDTLATVGGFLDWAASRRFQPCIVYVSTGHVYAGLAPGRRATELDPTAPRSVYARTKLLAESRLTQLCAERRIPLRIARVFGLVAPRQPAHYVLPALIRRARDGNVREIPGLDYSRDYLDARDVCDCLVRLAMTQAPAPTILNVCSGRPITIRELLEEIVRALRPDGGEQPPGQATAAPGRPDDVPWIVGDPARFVESFGRQPQRIPLRQTVADAIRTV